MTEEQGTATALGLIEAFKSMRAHALELIARTPDVEILVELEACMADFDRRIADLEG